MKKFCTIGIVSVLLMNITGCVIITGNDFKDANKCGIPKEAKRVGGGLEITFIAPDNGIINLVDRVSGKNLMSKSVIAGERYEFNARQLNTEEEKKWGIDVQKADFVLYFIPTPPKHPESAVVPVAPPEPIAPVTP